MIAYDQSNALSHFYGTNRSLQIISVLFTYVNLIRGQCYTMAVTARLHSLIYRSAKQIIVWLRPVLSHLTMC